MMQERPPTYPSIGFSVETMEFKNFCCPFPFSFPSPRPWAQLRDSLTERESPDLSSRWDTVSPLLCDVQLDVPRW